MNNEFILGLRITHKYVKFDASVCHSVKKFAHSIIY